MITMRTRRHYELLGALAFEFYLHHDYKSRYGPNPADRIQHLRLADRMWHTAIRYWTLAAEAQP